MSQSHQQENTFHPAPEAAPIERPEQPNKDRDAQGRFTHGNRGGPGNPFARQVAKLRSALVNRVTEADMQQIADCLVMQAKMGDVAAIKLLFQYVLGKPDPAVNPDTLDIEEWRQRHQPLGQIMKELPDTMRSLPAEMACDVADIAHLAGNLKVADHIEQTLRQAEKERIKRANKAKQAHPAPEPAESASPARKEEEAIAAPSANGTAESASPAKKQEEVIAAPSTNGVNGARIAAPPPSAPPEWARWRAAPEPSTNGHSSEDPRDRPTVNGRGG